MQLSSAMTVVSTRMKAHAVKMGYPSSRVSVIFPGANPDLVWPVDVQTARTQFRIDLQAQVVGYMGISSYDDELAGRTFAELARTLPGALLLAIGPPKPKLQAVIESANLQAWFRDLGYVPSNSLGAALSCADVLLLPFSDRPVNQCRFPSRFGEYLAAGRAMVVNETGDLGEVVRGEHVGLVTPDRPKEMAHAVQVLLEDTGLAREMGSRARQLAETRFSWNALARDVERLYLRAM